LRNARSLIGERQSSISRYYSTYDAVNPSWTPERKRIVVSNQK
jgi:hypothetical protein